MTEPASDRPKPVRLVALGDSISIDRYPGLDHGVRGPQPELPSEGLGAVSLLVRNRDDVWPEFAGLDLATRLGLGDDDVLDLTADGATTVDVLERKLPRVPESAAPTWVTLTAAGGNDLLQTLVSPSPDDEERVRGIPVRLREILEEVRRRRPAARLLVGTIYDPGDGSDRLPAGGGSDHFPRQGRWLRETNDAIRKLCDEQGAVRIDIERHFRGHGWQSKDCWLWPDLVFEPGARGASEVRRLWWDAIDERVGTGAGWRERPPEKR